LILDLLVFSNVMLPNEKQGQPIELKYADVLTKNTTGDGSIRQLLGNVKLKQGDVLVFCDKALQYLNSNKVELIGNVKILQEGLILESPHINYDGNTYIADAIGGVKIKDTNSTLTADVGTYSTQTLIADFQKNVKFEDDSAIIYSNAIQYHRTTRNSFAYGNVHVLGKYSSAILTGDTVINIPSAKYMQATGKPILYQIDTIKVINDIYKVDSTNLENKISFRDSITYKYDTLSVSADSMESIKDFGQEKYVFNHNVELVKGSAAAKASLANYYKGEDMITLEGKPIVWYDSTQLHADSIAIYIPGNKINYIYAYSFNNSPNKSVACSRSDTNYFNRINQITGKEIKINITSDSIRTIYSYGDAKSLYFSNEDNENSEAGAARNSADTINIYFDKGEPSQIIWLGGIQGEYFPERMFEKKEKEFYLPQFLWTDDKPKKKILTKRN
ncbi:MAG: OstA-like protein, partial [FCB group bacterium]